MPFDSPILVTGAAGHVGRVGRTVVELLRQRNLPVRALVRREDERAAALRATVTPAAPPSMVMALLTAKADGPSAAAGSVVVRLIVAPARAGAKVMVSGPGWAGSLLASRMAWRRVPGPLSPGSVTVKTAGAWRSSSASNHNRHGRGATRPRARERRRF